MTHDERLIDNDVFTDGESLAVIAVIPSASDQQAKLTATRAAVEKLREVAARDGWTPKGEAHVQVIATLDDLTQLLSDSKHEILSAFDPLSDALAQGAAVAFATQAITGPKPQTTGLIGSSLVSQTRERLRLARVLDHPGESGRAREEAIRQHIEEFMPSGLKLETGFVVDALDNQSRQIDLILYHLDYYPVFRVNGLPIVPIEAVVAVFEVKANVGSRAVLRDCYDVLASVKRLDRSNRETNRVLAGGSSIEVASQDYERFQLQVLGAVVAESSIGIPHWFDATQEWCASHPRRLWPNFFVSSSTFVGTYQSESEDGQTAITADTTVANCLAALSGSNSEDPLGFLSHEVLNFARVAVKVDYSPMSYLGGSRNLGVETRPFVLES